MTDTAVYAVSRNAYNAALSDDATSNTFPAPVRMTEATVVYRLTPAQAGEMSSHMFTVRDALKAAGDAYSSQQARSLDRAATKMARILASQPVAETTAADTDENNAMQRVSVKAASVRGEATFPHATTDGKTTLCGMALEETGSDFAKLLPASACPYCYRDAATLI